MKRSLLLCLLVAVVSASAAERSIEEMQSIAALHFRTTAHVKSIAGGIAETPRCALATEAYAIFESVSDEAFVIISKSSLTNPVIGYSQTAFDAENMPSGLRWFLSLAEKNIRAAEQSGKPLQTRRRVPKEPVEPFITTLWTQGDPFNLKTPNNYPAGCVAVALAQCINYCRYPSRALFRGYCYYTASKNSTRYTLDSIDVNSLYFYPYLDIYGRATESQKKSVATLLRDCGYAVNMMYTDQGSGSTISEAGIALTTRFSYPEECVKYMERNTFGGSSETWNDIIYTEIQHLCPIMCGAHDEEFGGHAFVFCGMDAEGMVYVNWGWGGSSNGYYDIELMNPDGFEFSSHQRIVYGIRSTPLPTDRPEPRIFSYDAAPYTFSFEDETDDSGNKHIVLHITFNAGMVNMSPCTFNGEFGLFGTDITTGSNWQIRETDPDIWAPGIGYYLREPAPIFYYYVEDELIPGHTYRISFGSRDKYEGQWHSILCEGGEIGYEIKYTGNPATCVISEKMEVLYDAVAAPRATGNALPADNVTRVYDTAGRLVYSAPSHQFNLWDVPARGILVVKQGKEARKVVR